MMKKTILEIYALAVCFFTVACFVITLSIMTWNIIEFSSPEFTLNNYEYQCHQTDQAYKDCFSTQEKYTREKSPELFPTGETLTTERESSYTREIKSEQREALQSIIPSIIVITINLLVFLVHWRLARRSRENNS